MTSAPTLEPAQPGRPADEAATRDAALTMWSVRRVSAGGVTPVIDWVAEEVPVALSFNGIAFAVMMASPQDLEDFAMGFAFTEGVIDAPSDVYGIDVLQHDQGIELQLQIAASCAWRLKERRRRLVGNTGCGLCGVESLSQVHQALAPVQRVVPTAWAVDQALKSLTRQQSLQQRSGATHAAAWCALDSGEALWVREDVGRHNALDKLIGAVWRQAVAVQSGFVVVTSRASYEMVQKAARFGCGALVAVSAPTSLAVRQAQSAGMCLLGFARDGGHVEYV